MRASETAPNGLREALIEYYVAARVRQERSHLSGSSIDLNAFIVAIAGELAGFWPVLRSSPDEVTLEDLRAFRQRIEARAHDTVDQRLAEASVLLDLAISLAATSGGGGAKQPDLRMIPGGGQGGISHAPLHLVPRTDAQGLQTPGACPGQSR
jgi:hypothetical protein